jgi:hypothetical protein
MHDIAQKHIFFLKTTRAGSGSRFDDEISGSGKKVRIRNTAVWILGLLLLSLLFFLPPKPPSCAFAILTSSLGGRLLPCAHGEDRSRKS